MLPNPLHPAIVHFPIVLMVLLPFVTAIVLWRLHDGARRRSWGLVVLSAALVTGSGWFAARTGRAQEEVVEDLVAEQPIHDHEEAAEAFVLVSWIVLGIAVVGAVPGLAGRAGRALTLAGALALVYFGWRVGDLGGKLAYQHGAAAAYVTPGAGAPAARPAGESHDDHDDRDEH
jgi:uncharacterized membrane protein